ncbi:MAG: type I restriction endonuclease subunit R [Acholeplasmatales bacterium]|nr:type I restriction endonuclease subunit R [Acholeplasmatales bacterium]
MGNRAKSEYEVEDILLDRLESLGYSFVSLSNYSDLIKNFRKQLCLVNADKLIEKKGIAELSDSEFDRVLLRLDNHTIYESAKVLREQWVLTLDNGKNVYLSFLFDEFEKNTFQVTHQITMDKEHKDDVVYKNRYDVTILINGLPLIQIELKRPGVEINEAINQINRYRRFSFRGLFRYIQVFIVSNSVQTKYFANVNERGVDGQIQPILKSLVFYWTKEDNSRINKLIEFTNDFLLKNKVIELLTKYFVIKQSEPVMMVMRPYQIYAVKKSFDRIIMSDLNGFVFHTTGSGKTLTSYKLASLLRDDKRIDKVFFLIDRKDLDDQTVDEYNSFEPNCVDNTVDTKTLVESLSDSTKTLIVTTIQKMASALRSEKYASIMDQYRSSKVVFIIDECHRSQFGKMHSSIDKHFKNSNYIGFTGTPIFKENKSADGRTTADVFKSGKLDSCIHKYMIKEAIADGNVLKFSVEYMRSVNIKNVNDSKIDVDLLDDPDYCKRHKIDLDKIYHDEKRIELVSEDILSHLEQHIKPSGKDVYTAIFATDYISTLMQYYRYMRDHNPKNYKIAAIFTYQANEDLDDGADEYSGELLKECIKDYNNLFGTSFTLDTFDAYRKDISKRLKQKDLPQVDLLLVVNMFLTGFDSKATNTLILDKNLIWHSLVQAYSRTNRVSKITKQFGQIITYRNIKKAQDDALRLYSGDGNPNDYLLENYEFYCAEYRKCVEDLRVVALTPEAAGYIQSENDKRAYIFAFRKLASVLSTLKTFSKFDWKDLEIFLDEEEFMEYKSWYLTFYDEMKNGGGGKVSVLADVDFEIELIRTDKINVVYILNLLKDINRKDKNEMEKSIDLILREIERSDNEKMRYKKDIMKNFIQVKFFELDPEEDIIAAYEEYEKQCMRADIEEFSKEKDIDVNLLTEIVTKFFVDPKQVTKENIRIQLSSKGLGLLKMTKLINDILLFINDMNNKYTAEGI